uniref:Uncharacterized protein n=1 Tax=Cacopsylla melanoneura TaxID=428564 RepID=A0A8D8V6P6_9HEMI
MICLVIVHANLLYRQFHRLQCRRLDGRLGAFPLGQHRGLVQQIDHDDGRIHLASFTVHLHGDGLGGDNFSGLALSDTDAMSACLEQRQMICGETDYFYKTIVSFLICPAPRVGASTVTRYVEKYNGMDSMFF